MSLGIIIRLGEAVVVVVDHWVGGGAEVVVGVVVVSVCNCVVSKVLGSTPLLTV